MSTKVENQMTVEILADFADAWTRHDLDALMSFMSDDCKFQLSIGPDIDGASFVGRDQVREGYKKVLDLFPDGQWVDDSHFVAGDRGVSEWTFKATGPDGNQIEVRGCDIFTFQGDKISVKNSFRKTRTS